MATQHHPFRERGVSLLNGLHQRRTALLDRFASTPAPNDIKPVGKRMPGSMDRTPGRKLLETSGRPVPTSLDEDTPLGGTTPSSCRGNFSRRWPSPSRTPQRLTAAEKKFPLETSQGRTQEVFV